METSSARFSLQKIAKIAKKTLYFSWNSGKTMAIRMFFRELTGKLAQKLQKTAPVLCVLILCSISPGNLYADEWPFQEEEPVVLFEDALLPAIELRDGIISEVIVESKTDVAIADSTSKGLHSCELSNFNPNHKTSSLFSVSRNKTNIDFSFQNEIVDSPFVFLVSGEEILCSAGYSADTYDSNSNRKEGEGFSVKSVANVRLFGFLGICLNRSELPSKNFSMQCENSQPRSMTQRSASDWRYSWQQVKTTSLWLMSTNSSRIRKTSILRPSKSRIRSMSDISSTWSNGMGACRVISLQAMKAVQVPMLGQNREKRPIPQGQRLVVLNLKNRQEVLTSPMFL